MIEYQSPLRQVKKVPDHIKDFEYIWSGMKGVAANKNSWAGRAQTNMQIYLQDVEGTGTLYTEAQLEFIENTSRMPVNINKIYPKLEQRAAFIALSKPTQSVVSHKEEDNDFAMTLQQCKMHIESNSTALVHFTQMLDEMHNTGLGFEIVETIERGILSPDELPIKSRFLSYENVIVDAEARSPIGDDWRGVFIKESISKANFRLRFKELFVGMKDLDGNPLDMEEFLKRRADSSRSVHENGLIEIKNYYEPIYTTLYLMDMPNGDVRRIFAENGMPELRPVLESLPEESKMESIYWKKYFIVEDLILAETMLPIRTCPVIMYWFKWGGTAYKSKGLTHYVANAQFALDRALQTFILNGMLANNKGYTAPKNSISPEDKVMWEKHATNPLVLKEYNIVVGADGKTYRPEREEVNSLSSFYPQIIELLSGSIDEITAMTPFMQGDPKNNIDVFSVLARYQDSAMKRIELSLQNLGVSLEQKAKVIVDYVMGVLEPNKEYFISNRSTKLEALIVPEDILKIRNMKFTITSSPDQMMPIQRQMAAKEMFNIAQTSTDENLRNVLTSEAISLSGLTIGPDIQEKVDYANKITQENSSLKEHVERMEEITKQLENRVINAELKARIAEEMTKAVGDLREAKGKHKTEIEGKSNE